MAHPLPEGPTSGLHEDDRASGTELAQQERQAGPINSFDVLVGAWVLGNGRVC